MAKKLVSSEDITFEENDQNQVKGSISENAKKNLSNLIAEYRVETATTEISITGLDIVRDGGVYEIVIMGRPAVTFFGIFRMAFNKEKNIPFKTFTKTISIKSTTNAVSESNTFSPIGPMFMIIGRMSSIENQDSICNVTVYLNNNQITSTSSSISTDHSTKDFYITQNTNSCDVITGTTNITSIQIYGTTFDVGTVVRVYKK